MAGLGSELTTPGTIGAGGVFNGSASQTYAALTRQQWANYVETFVPVENQLIKYATDTSLPGQDMAKASANVQAAYAQQAGATQRKLSGLGVQLSDDEQQAQTRAQGLSKSLADVQAQNVAGDLTRTRQQTLLGNPMPNATTVAAQSGV